MSSIKDVFVDLIQTALEKAKQRQSKVTREVLLMEGMSGQMTRHFYNNLCAHPDARYLEIGTWKGSTICAAMCGNAMKHCLCVDNWSEFGGPKAAFMQNFSRHVGKNKAKFIEKNCWALKPARLGKFNIYLYDGDHKTHAKAMSFFLPCLDPVFICLVDDWNHPPIRAQTEQGICEAGLKTLWKTEIFSGVNPGVQRGPNINDWHNGLAVFVFEQPLGASLPLPPVNPAAHPRVMDTMVEYFKDHPKLTLFPKFLWAAGVSAINTTLAEVHKMDSNQPTMFLVVDDHEGPLAIHPNQVVFRTSLRKSALHPCEFPLPFAWGMTMTFRPLPRTPKPIVGFCGVVSPPRQKLIAAFRADSRFVCHFVLRQQFMGVNTPVQAQVRYKENMQGAQFNICSRGAGNFSMRFYETLEAGRIPVLVDTDIILPFDDQIFWSDYVVMAKSEEEVLEKILDMWEHRDIERVQHDCAMLYQQYFHKYTLPRHLERQALSVIQ